MVIQVISAVDATKQEQALHPLPPMAVGNDMIGKPYLFCDKDAMEEERRNFLVNFRGRRILVKRLKLQNAQQTGGSDGSHPAMTAEVLDIGRHDVVGSHALCAALLEIVLEIRKVVVVNGLADLICSRTRDL